MDSQGQPKSQLQNSMYSASSDHSLIAIVHLLVHCQKHKKNKPHILPGTELILSNSPSIACPSTIALS